MSATTTSVALELARLVCASPLILAVLLAGRVPPTEAHGGGSGGNDEDAGENPAFAFGVSVLAGLATTLGSLFAFATRGKSGKTTKRVLAASLAFAAGVMIMVSFGSLLSESRENLEEDGYKGAANEALVMALFFVGIVLTVGLDAMIHRLDPSHSHDFPEFEGALSMDGLGGDRGSDLHESLVESGGSLDSSTSATGTRVSRVSTVVQLQSTGLLTFLALALHNLPEGIITFVSTVKGRQLGLSVGLAVAFHNIPEGIAMAVPIYHGYGSKWRTFLSTLIAGLCQPLGALLAWAALGDDVSKAAFGLIFSAVAGIMVYVSLAELFPSALKFDASHGSVVSKASLVAGMAVMAASVIGIEAADL